MDHWYIDTGVFVTPMLKNLAPETIDRCRAILHRIEAGELRATTSLLTWDEVTWIAGKQGGRYDATRAVRAGRLLLALAHVTFVDVDGAVVDEASNLMARLGLKPRDCIHASTALLFAGGNLVTMDSDFLDASSQLAKAGLNVASVDSLTG